LKDINWVIRTGERWHLQGANGNRKICSSLRRFVDQYLAGSGKTTLLSLLTGDHPQSYTQRPRSDLDRRLELFSRPRHNLATSTLKTLVGIVSPELGNAFPRRQGMTVWEAVATGFEGSFIGTGARGVGTRATWKTNREDGLLDEDEETWRINRVWEIVEALGPAAWGRDGRDATSATKAFAQREFADLSSGEQSIVLLARALVGRQRLIILDEVWSGMDADMIGAARRYMNSEAGVSPDQAVVVVSHWEEEVPWNTEDGLKKYKLEDGRGRVML
jgi:ABC-type molybdenum transport system ATPase subunit/photorepair protein PhrA